jgi:hypothetical protein
MVDYKHKILNLIIDNEKKYALLDYKTVGSDRNIICYNLDGSILWQVEKIDQLHAENYFTSIYIDNGNLYAYNTNGLEVVIDKETGKFLSKELIK